MRGGIGAVGWLDGVGRGVHPASRRPGDRPVSQRLVYATCIHCAAVTTHEVDVLKARSVVVGNER